MYFRYGSSNIPHPQKRYKGGEDAWFVEEDLMVVADGVGGWEAHGIDSGLFSKQLVKDIKQIFDNDKRVPLKEVLRKSVARNNNIGSSTVTMATFDLNRPDVILTTNLGDSGYIIIRPSLKKPRTLKKVFRSEAQ